MMRGIAKWAAVLLVIALLVGLAAAGQTIAKGNEGNEANQANQGNQGNDRLPVAATVPADGVRVVRPDTPIEIRFETRARAWVHVREQLEKGHFQAALNGAPVRAVYNPDQAAVRILPDGLLDRYTEYAVEFVLHGSDSSNHSGGGNREGWSKKTCAFSFETGSALHEPRHLQVALSTDRVQVTEAAVLSLSFTDDYGQPGWGAAGTVVLQESGRRLPGSAAADPSCFEVPVGSDGKVEVKITDREAETVVLAVYASGPYPGDAAVDGGNAADGAAWRGNLVFLPGPPASLSVGCAEPKVVVGTQAALAGTVEDVYGNPVEDGTEVSLAASAGTVASPVLTSQGAFSAVFAAPEKKQVVRVEARSGEAAAALDIPLLAGPPARVDVEVEKAKALVGTSLGITARLWDRYGNAVEDGVGVAFTSLAGLVGPALVPTAGGTARAVLSCTAAGAVEVVACAGDASGRASVLVVAPPPAGSRVPFTVKPLGDGTFVLAGAVTGGQGPVSGAGVPLTVVGGVLSDPLPVTDATGSFSVTVTPSGVAVVGVDASAAPEVAAPRVGICPVVSGSASWTDTGMDVPVGALVRVESYGPWASDLLARVGDSGSAVPVGGSGGFVAAQAGRLYLGSGGARVGDVAAVVYLDDPAALGLAPAVSLSVSPDELPADGSAAAEVTGTVSAGQYPVVDGVVVLSAQLGALPASAVTDAAGAFRATYTAGSSPGLDTLTASWGGASATAALTLQAVQPALHQVRVPIAAGAMHALALAPDGGVVAWGRNDCGQLGDGTCEDRALPVRVRGVSGAVAVAAGEKHSLALLSDGRVLMWGGTDTKYTTPVEVPGIRNAVAIAAGHGHSLAVLSDGRVVAWGLNLSGQLGDGTTVSRPQPVEVQGIKNAVAVAAGASHSMAVLSDGTLWAWGNNYFGKLGDGTWSNRTVPVQVKNLCGVVAACGGWYHSMALLSDGTVFAWGAGPYLGLGPGAQPYSSVPVQVPGVNGAVAISSGAYHCLVVLADGSARAWGSNWFGQLGDGRFVNDQPSPVKVQGVEGAVAACGGHSASFFLLADGRVLACGGNAFGILGQGAFHYLTRPAYVPGIQGVRSVAAGAHSLFLLSDGRVLSCGNNSHGQTGSATENCCCPVPAPVAGLDKVSAVAVGPSHSVALLSDGRVMTWGWGGLGQLGAGYGVKQTSTPVQVLGITSATAVAVDGDYTLALLADGRVMAWGMNLYGQLGDGTTTNRFTPTPVSGITNAVAIAAAGNSSYALLADGRVMAWGANWNGSLGDGTTTPRTRPGPVKGLSGVVRIWAATEACFAQTSDGRVFAWGWNLGGKLGDGTTQNQLEPVEIQWLKDARYIVPGSHSSVACLADGRVVAWGRNDEGQLGDGTIRDSLTPVAVCAPEVLVQVSGYHGRLAVMPDGRVVAWGSNMYGGLGDPDSGPQSLPVEVRWFPR